MMRYGVIGLILVLGILSFGCLGKWSAATDSHEICVKSKFIDNNGEYGSAYMIVDTDGNAWEVDRSFVNFGNVKANPDVLYGSMETGRRYLINTSGARIDAFYNYPLIQAIEDKGECPKYGVG